MIELLASAAPILGVAAGVAAYVAHNYRKELVEARLDLGIARGDARSMTERATDLRRQTIAQQTTIDTLREGHDRLVDERESFRRELGRLKAEMVAAKPKRGKGGRFVAKPKAPKPIKPIACG